MAAKKKASTRRYGKKAGAKVARAMRERKAGTLRSGRSGKKVTSKKQAVAIGLSEARSSGVKVPKKPRRGTTKKRTAKTGAKKRASSRTTASKK